MLRVFEDGDSDEVLAATLECTAMRPCFVGCCDVVFDASRVEGVPALQRLGKRMSVKLKMAEHTHTHTLAHHPKGREAPEPQQPSSQVQQQQRAAQL